MEKTARQNAIRQIVATRRVTSQAELVTQLRRSGITSTQASVSRDIRELGLIKASGRYMTTLALEGDGNVAHDGFVTSVDAVGANLIVVKTHAGAAAAVAEHIDTLGDASIAGTVAGDNTIMVAVRSRSAQGRVLARLRQRSL